MSRSRQTKTATLDDELSEAEREIEQELGALEQERKRVRQMEERAERRAKALASARAALHSIRQSFRQEFHGLDEEEIEAQAASEGLDRDLQDNLQTEPNHQQTEGASQDSADPNPQGRGGRGRMSRRAPR